MEETINQIRLHYRLAKSAEQSRIITDQRLVSFVRVYLTAWNPGAEEADRAKHKEQATRIIKTLVTAAGKMEEGQTIFDAIAKPHKDDVDLYPLVAEMVLNSHPSRAAFDAVAKQHQKSATKLVETLPAWERIGHVKGFSAWGLAVLIGEAGDIGNYSGCRKLYKRLGWAPKECYETGETGGRKIPRQTKGRIYGIITESLIKAQWRGEKDNVAPHPIGPFGEVYGAVKARGLESGKTKGHAHKLALRAMTKALIHDVHRAWHEMPLDYAA